MTSHVSTRPITRIRHVAAVLGIVALVGFMLATIPACNTVEGVGRDLEATGDAIGDAADDAKD
ncbi:MAG: entericidin A/B family lipoprotein [Phycisphaerales bacterium]|nr:entericidin A/B family lipoprotein [Phycisphaerales bacterium]